MTSAFSAAGRAAIATEAIIDRLTHPQFSVPSHVARTVDCLRACHSIEDPMSLRTQRDALLAACREALDYIGSGSHGETQDMLRAAIAACEIE